MAESSVYPGPVLVIYELWTMGKGLHYTDTGFFFLQNGENKPCPACTLSLMRAYRVNTGESAAGKS